MALTGYLVAVTASATINTKGAYAEVVASLPYDSSRLHFIVSNSNAANNWVLLDIAKGAAGAESVVVANMALQIPGEAVFKGSVCAIDLDLPAGTRVAIRIQASTTASLTIYPTLYFEDRPLASIANPVTYGTTLVSSRGTTIPAPGTANTEGAWTQLTAATTARIDAVLLCFQKPTANTVYAAYTEGHVDIGTGAAGAETAIISNIRLIASVTHFTLSCALVRFPIQIPAGTRLAARIQSNRTPTEANVQLTVIGMQEPTVAGGGGSAYAAAYLG